MTPYGELIRRHRVAVGLTQEELAALSGLNVRTISDIERCRTIRPHRTTVDLIARALGRDELGYEAVRARQFVHAQASGHLLVPPEPVGDPSNAAQRAAGPAQPLAGLRSAEGGAAEQAAAGSAIDLAVSAMSGDVRAWPAVDVFPVVIGFYADADLADLEAEAPAGRLTELLAPFGGRHRPWRHPVRGRGADAIQHRLREWAGPARPSWHGRAGEPGGTSAGRVLSAVLGRARLVGRHPRGPRPCREPGRGRRVGT